MSDRLSECIALLGRGRIAVLTGAGCSTESGIPDYRGPDSDVRAVPPCGGSGDSRLRPRRPIQHREFMEHEPVRRRYWARSAIGWPRMAAARPNAAHRAIAELESSGRLTGLITQNVDRLHHKAGSRAVLELHGALADVRCTDCGVLESRDEVQRRIGELNPNFLVDGSAEGGTSRTTKVEVSTAPDGDADLGAELIDTFRIPACVACDGVLKPDVVFFGGNVPRDRVSAAFAMLDSAGALLVVGSSLAVFSGYRFVLRAADLRIPIAIVNRGETRGDRHAEFRIDAAAGDVLPTLARALC